MENKRIAFLDYTRIFAIFMVILVHASENFYGADSSGLAGNVSMLANQANRFWVAFYDGGIARICVPLFFMISAYLLVPMKKDMTMTGFYKRRFGHILIPFVFFLLAYTFLPLLWGQMTWEQSWADFKRLPLNFPSMAGHLWFMYPLISLYLFIPIISPWLEKATAKEERIFLYIFCLSTLITWFHRLLNQEVWGECFWNSYHMLWYCSGFIGYLVLAHYVRFHIDWSTARKLKVGIPCWVLGAAFTFMSFYVMGTPGKVLETPLLEWSWEFCTPNLLVSTFGAFLVFSCIPEEHHAPKFVTELSRLSFGIYLVHLFFLSNISKVFVNGDQANPLVHVGLAIPCIAILSFICSAVAVKLISLIPFGKKIVGY